MTRLKPAKADEMTTHPDRFFDTPEEVLADARLSKARKLEALRALEIDARQLEVAAEEAMSGGEPSDLAAIREAIRSLDPRGAEKKKPAGDTKL